MGQPKTREEVLNCIRDLVGAGGRTSIGRRSVFCPRCGDDISVANTRPGARFVCPNKDCSYSGDRAFVFDGRTRWVFNTGSFLDVPIGEIVHFSVGAVIERNSRFLLLRRSLYPIGEYSIPAGHIEEGESSQSVAIRETYEETGLAVISASLIADGVILNEPCRRSVDYHVWSFYACNCIGDPRMSYESDILGWYTFNELKSIPLTIPTKYIVQSFGR